MKNSQLKKYRRATGGGHSISTEEQLTHTEEQILDTINTTAINGHENITESEVLFVRIPLFSTQLYCNKIHYLESSLLFTLYLMI